VEEERSAPRPTRTRYARYRQAEGFSLGEVIGKSFSIWGRKMGTLLLIMVIVYSPLVVYKGVQVIGEPLPTEMVSVEDDEVLIHKDVIWRMAGEGIGAFLLSFVAQAAVIFAVLQELRGEQVSVGESLRVSMGRLLPVVGVTLIVFVCLMATGALMGLAVGLGGLLLLLLLPFGLFWLCFLWCTLWVAVPAVIVERTGVFGALRRSARLTRGCKWRIMGILLIVLAVQWAGGGLVGVVSMGSVRAGLVIELSAMLLVGALTATSTAVGYHDLRVAKEGVGVDDLLKVFA